MINDLRGKYRPLSNFWSCFIVYKEEVYPSVENAYQAAKMSIAEDRKKFLYCKASEAKQLGKLLPMRFDWKDLVTHPRFKEQNEHQDIQKRVVIMYDLVLQKFSSNDFLKDLLFETGVQEIQEGNWWGDTFWGTVNGVGTNWLGVILMKVRDDIKGY